MNLSFIFRVLKARNILRSHDQWSVEELNKHQAKSLTQLRSFAYEKSPFYKKFHRGLCNAPLPELPVLTKKMLMENFDEIVTDPGLKLRNLQNYIATLKGNDKYLDRYWVSSTSGSTGLKGLFPSNEEEWIETIASYSRANDWAGVKAGLTNRLKLAVVSSITPWHQSARVGATLKSWWVPTVRLDSTEPMEQIIAELNSFQPQSLVSYANMAKLLAEEQLSGKLKISPNAVFCSSEVLTEEAGERIFKAFGVQPFNVYAATETAGIASECNKHAGLHIYEDLVIPEIVDDSYQEVPVETFGTKILVSVLFSRTIPLIRYEMSDSVKLSNKKCSCGLPYRIITDIQGRNEETIYLPKADNTLVRIEPNLFHQIMELVPTRGWQIVQENINKLNILIYKPYNIFSETDLTGTLSGELNKKGVNPEIHIQYVDALIQNQLGKIILIKAYRK